MVTSNTLVLLQQGMGTGQQLLLGVGGIALGVYVLANTGNAVPLFRNMVTSEVTPAAEVPGKSGVVEVTGAAKPLDETVQSPHTETECLLYDYNKTRIRRDDHDHDGIDESERREHLDHKHDHVRFRVEDDSGSITVDPAGANFSVDRDDVDGHKETTDQGIQITENRIDIGETVHVRGKPQSGDATPDGGVYVGDGSNINFRIGTGGRTEAVAEVGTQAVVTVLFGVVCILGGGFFLLALAGVV
jgi:hypothetical protein